MGIYTIKVLEELAGGLFLPTKHTRRPVPYKSMLLNNKTKQNKTKHVLYIQLIISYCKLLKSWFHEAVEGAELTSHTVQIHSKKLPQQQIASANNHRRACKTVKYTRYSKSCARQRFTVIDYDGVSQTVHATGLSTHLISHMYSFCYSPSKCYA